MYWRGLPGRNQTVKWQNFDYLLNFLVIIVFYSSKLHGFHFSDESRIVWRKELLCCTVCNKCQYDDRKQRMMYNIIMVAVIVILQFCMAGVILPLEIFTQYLAESPRRPQCFVICFITGWLFAAHWANWVMTRVSFIWKCYEVIEIEILSHYFYHVFLNTIYGLIYLWSKCLV